MALIYSQCTGNQPAVSQSIIPVKGEHNLVTDGVGGQYFSQSFNVLQANISVESLFISESRYLSVETQAEVGKRSAHGGADFLGRVNWKGLASAYRSRKLGGNCCYISERKFWPGLLQGNATYTIHHYTIFTTVVEVKSKSGGEIEIEALESWCGLERIRGRLSQLGGCRGTTL